MSRCANRTCGSTRSWPHCPARRGGGAASSSRIRRSPTSAACTRSSGSPRLASSAGTCCSTAPPSRPPTRWTRGDRRRLHPLSFYKLFGYPTGCGCLIARREALARLRRPWFAGGTITLASVQEEDWYHLAPGATGFEDGTIDYLGLPAVTIGLEHLEGSARGSTSASACSRPGCSRRWRRCGTATATPGAGLRAAESTAVARPSPLSTGPGRRYDVFSIEAAADRRGISVRTGCFCNPGDGEIAHHISRDDMDGCF